MFTEPHLAAQFQTAEDEYIKADEAVTENFDKENILALMQAIPEDLRARFKEEILIGEVTRVGEVIGEIGSIYPELGKFLQNLDDGFS